MGTKCPLRPRFAPWVSVCMSKGRKSPDREPQSTGPCPAIRPQGRPCGLAGPRLITQKKHTVYIILSLKNSWKLLIRLWQAFLVFFFMKWLLSYISGNTELSQGISSSAKCCVALVWMLWNTRHQNTTVRVSHAAVALFVTCSYETTVILWCSPLCLQLVGNPEHGQRWLHCSLLPGPADLWNCDYWCK